MNKFLKVDSLLKKIILLTSLSALILCCSNDDDSKTDLDPIDTTRLLKQFVEPNLNFGISKEEFLDFEGVPDAIRGNFNRYYTNINGLSYYSYKIAPQYGVGDIIYSECFVQIEDYQQNLEFLLNWLTEKYKSPFFIEISGDTMSTYQWDVVEESYYVNLNFSRKGIDPDDATSSNLFISYQYYK